MFGRYISSLSTTVNLHPNYSTSQLNSFTDMLFSSTSILFALVAMSAAVSARTGPVLFARDVELAVRATDNTNRSEYHFDLCVVLKLNSWISQWRHKQRMQPRPQGVVPHTRYSPMPNHDDTVRLVHDVHPILRWSLQIQLSRWRIVHCVSRQ